MAEYRLYFFDASGHIFARHEFAAPDDETAISAACVAGDASGDMHSGYAVWRADRELFSQETRTPRLVQPLGAVALPNGVQAIVLDMERRLCDSQWAVARSKTLLAALEDLEQKKQAS